MGKTALAFVTAMLLLRTPLPASAQANRTTQPPVVTASAEATNRIAGFMSWDDDFLYLAVQVNKPNSTGKNSEPFSKPLEDDAILIYLQTDNDHEAKTRTARTITFAASAVGGVQLYTGEKAIPLFNGLTEFNSRLEAINKNEVDAGIRQAKTVALLRSLIKNATTPKGAMRAIGSNAAGYTVEAAIPWSDLGGKPEPGTKMGFHVVAQSISAGSPPLQVLSPRVKAASDLDNPSLWNTVVFSNTPAAFAKDTYTCPRVFGGKPSIDGIVNNGEWNGLSLFEFGERVGPAGGNTLLANTLAARVRPEFTPVAPRPLVAVAVPRPTPLAAFPRQAQKVTPLVMARYLYRFQADTRKQSPPGFVWQADGSTALAQHSLLGSGPWFSYDRVDWHRRQLQEARRSGVDVVLPVYRGAPRDRQIYADKGLMVLTSALQYLRQAGEDYPQVGLFLDTSSLIDILGDRLDLREAGAQTVLYGVIRDFYRRIPVAFRCQVALSAQNGGRRACPVFLSDVTAFKEIDGSFIATLRSRFAADFEGADLVLIGATNFKGKAPLDGYFAEAGDKNGAFNQDGWIKTATVSPGYDTIFTQNVSETPLLRPRRSGETYRSDWSAVLAKRPDWVLIDSWNDFSTGAAVAPTLEYGYVNADVTRINTRQFAGLNRLGVKFLTHDAPSVLPSGRVYSLHIRAQNTGIEGWATPATPGLNAVAFTYRWMKGGQVVATGATSTIPNTLSGENVNATLTVQTPDAEGDYTLEVGAVSMEKRNSPFIAEDSPGAVLPISVSVRKGGEAIPEWAATLVRSDLPTMLETGSVYEVRATLRNDGSTPWRKADGGRVTLRLYRSSPADSPMDNTSGAADTVVTTADATAELTEDVLPGQEVAVRLNLPLLDAEGKPLPAWKQDDLWSYVARWEVAADRIGGTVKPVSLPAGSANSAVGVSIAPMPVLVSDFDFGVRFTSDGTPAMLPGQRRLPVRLSLQNTGRQTWKAESVRVGYHWYYQDGTEFLWEDETTPLPQDVLPGGRFSDMLAWVTAPPMDGTYWLVWDVKVGDTWASTTAGTRAFDQIVRQVRVVSGRLIFADLTKAYNLDGITEDDKLNDGNFDGQGLTFPAALVPPYTDMPVMPATMWLPAVKQGPDSPRRIGFRWGPKDTKAPNFISCVGQRVELGKSSGPCRILHILAASTGKDVSTNIKLIFKEPSTFSEDLYAFSVSRWDQPPKGSEEVAFLSRRYHDRKGVQNGSIALYHYVLKMRDARQLVAVVLPNAPQIKIAAMTLEK